VRCKHSRTVSVFDVCSEGHQHDGPQTARRHIVAVPHDLNETKNERTEDFMHLDNETFGRLRGQILRWTEDNADALAKVKVEAPPGFHNRRRANWQPLLAIAEAAGWKETARKAAMAIEATYAGFDASIGVQLLSDIMRVFDEQETDRITSAAMVAALAVDETRPWATFHRGKPLTQNQLARLLKDFEIKPKLVRAGSEVGRGYLLEQFKDAFERHLPPPPNPPENPSTTVTPLQVNDFNGLEQKPTVTRTVTVTGQGVTNAEGAEGVTVQAVTVTPPVTAQNADNLLKNNNCNGVTVQTPVLGRDEVCAQCGAALPGPLLHALVVEGEVRLHRECVRFWLKSHPQPKGRLIPLVQITEARTDIVNGGARR
jgi:uncharacterized protein DUF3631